MHLYLKNDLEHLTFTIYGETGYLSFWNTFSTKLPKKVKTIAKKNEKLTGKTKEQKVPEREKSIFSQF